MIGNLHAMDRHAVGDKVYGTGTRTATAGHVDPTGYVERGLRSRLAAAVLSGRQQSDAQRNDEQQTALTPQMFGETAFRSSMGALARMLIAKRRVQ